ncbi:MULTISPECIES: tetratricopeptide repeat protein [Micromonospora]|uniref:tetratricopeptide repeat protein n=1 Tax=Micromonospora TaxID=1873 RepID=UPI0021C686A2|nr:tetratricopeptide repeat protein [Micromonospora sp. Mcm103]
MTEGPTVRNTGDGEASDGAFVNTGYFEGDVHIHHAGKATLKSLLRTAPVDGRLPRVRDVDPHSVGATPTRHSLAGAAPYVARQADHELRAALAAEPFVLVVGATKAGKSRTAFEAVLAFAPGAAFVHPVAGRGAVREILEIDVRTPIDAGELVIWLDDLHAYLDAGALDVAELDLAAKREPRAVVVATIPSSRSGDAEPARLVLHRARRGRVHLPRALDRDELDLARQLYPGEDFSDPLVGVAERLVAIEELAMRLAAAEDENPHGFAATQAAIDWIRMGRPRPLTGERLRELYAREMDHLFPWPHPDDAGFLTGVDWACRPAISQVALVRYYQALGVYDALDYFADQADEQGRPIPDGAWRYAVEVSDSAELVTVGAAAIRAGEPDRAATILTAAAGQGEPRAWVLLGNLAAERGDPEAAEQFYRQAADAGEPDALSAIGLLCARLGRAEEAEAWLRAAAQVDADPNVAYELGRLAAERDDLVEAEYWARAAVAGGLREALVPLARLLAGTGREEEALAFYGDAGQGDDPPALLARAEAAELRGEHQEALRLSVQAVEGGDLAAVAALAQRYLDIEDHAAAEPLLRRLVDGTGDPVCRNYLGNVLHLLGRPAEAVTCYLPAADHDPQIALNLVMAYASIGNTVASEEWLARAAATGLPEAVTELGNLRFEQGDLAEAKRLYETVEAAYELGVVAECDGDVSGKIRWYGKAARAGDPRAAARLGHILADQDRLVPAEYWLRRADIENDPAAERLLRSVRFRRQQRRGRHLASTPAGETDLRAAAEAGDAESMVALAKLLAARDEPSGEELAWWEEAFHQGHLEAVVVQGMLLELAYRGEEALNLFTSAAERSSAEAAWRAAGVLLRTGRAREAERWLRQAAYAGNAEAAHNLAVLASLSGDMTTARRCSRKAAEAGCAPAMQAYGWLLWDDGDRAGARDWWLRAFEAGRANAAVSLAQERDDEQETERWLRLAAERDDPDGCFLLGVTRERAEADDEAMTWYAKAADQGHPEGTYRLALLTERGGDRPSSEPIYLRAAVAGHAGAAYSIADLLARRQLHSLAEHWYRKAALAGHARAALHVGAYIDMRNPGDPEAVAWFTRWKQNEDGPMMRYQAPYVDPEQMSVTIILTRREPGGDALYAISVPVMTIHF